MIGAMLRTIKVDKVNGIITLEMTGTDLTNIMDSGQYGIEARKDTIRKSSFRG